MEAPTRARRHYLGLAANLLITSSAVTVGSSLQKRNDVPSLAGHDPSEETPPAAPSRLLQADRGWSLATTEPLTTSSGPQHHRASLDKPEFTPHEGPAEKGRAHIPKPLNAASTTGEVPCVKRTTLGPVRVPGMCEGGCEAWWSQCDGECYLGLGCCAEGSECQEHWGQGKICIPRSTVSDCSEGAGPDGCAQAYCQCNGSHYKGPTCCAEGTQCTEATKKYSFCKPVCALAI
jgi:hypothetical protein